MNCDKFDMETRTTTTTPPTLIQIKLFEKFLFPTGSTPIRENIRKVSLSLSVWVATAVCLVATVWPPIVCLSRKLERKEEEEEEEKIFPYLTCSLDFQIAFTLVRLLSIVFKDFRDGYAVEAAAAPAVGKEGRFPWPSENGLFLKLWLEVKIGFSGR